MCFLQLPDHFFDKKHEAAPNTAPPRFASPGSAYPTIEAVFAHRSLIAGTLIAAGVQGRYVSDGIQIVATEAWLAIRAGRYRPDPAMPSDVALRCWLRAVAYRQAKNIRVAWLRREVPVADPGALDACEVHDPHRRLDARDALLVLDALPTRYRDVLALVALGLEIGDVARELGITEWAAVSRLRIGRAELASLLAGRSWRRP